MTVFCFTNCLIPKSILNYFHHLIYIKQVFYDYKYLLKSLKTIQKATYQPKSKRYM